MSAVSHPKAPLAVSMLAGVICAAGCGDGAKVPVENGARYDGRLPGSIDSHWRFPVLQCELMNTYGGNFSADCTANRGQGGALSAITIQSLADLGYEVDLDGADPYRMHWLAGSADAALSGLQERIGFADDVLRGPIVVVDRTGRVVGDIRY